MSQPVVMIFVYIFEMLTSYCFFSRIYEKKLKSNVLIFFIGLLLFISSAVIFNLFENELINTSLFFVINVVYSLICFDISFKNAAILSVILDTIMVSTEYLTIFIVSVLLNIPTNRYKNDLHTLIIVVIICKLMYFILSQLLSFVIIRVGNKKINIKRFLPVFVFPVIIMVFCMVILLVSLRTEVSTTSKLTSAVICVLYIFESVFIFIYYQMFADNEARINELESEKRLYNLNKNYLEILEHQNNELQMVFHDTKNHYAAICGFDNVEDVRDYISKIYPELEQKTVIKISSNKMLDSIISKYVVLCKKNHIKFNYEVKTANLDYIDDAELSVILNNMLDNAVESAKESSDRSIEFSLRHISNMDLLSVVNSCDHPPRHNNKKLLTTKFDTNNHGFGTRIIEKHAKMNNGKYEWFYDDDERRFHSTILFQQKKNESGTV